MCQCIVNMVVCFVVWCYGLDMVGVDGNFGMGESQLDQCIEEIMLVVRLCFDFVVFLDLVFIGQVVWLWWYEVYWVVIFVMDWMMFGEFSQFCCIWG